MRGTVAKRLRRKVLGADYSVRSREYTIDKAGSVHCTGKRPEYQQAKKERYAIKGN